MNATSNGRQGPHPAAVFHREVLTAQHWARIQRDFLLMLQSLPSSSAAFEWKEPRKLWRHSNEALGKWILSQIARLPATAAEDAAFFPTAAVLTSCGMAGSYDDQLVRDLSLKSSAQSDEALVESLRQAVLSFQLLQRCTEAAAAVEQAMSNRTSASFMTPAFRYLEQSSELRSPSQRRIQDVVVEITPMLNGRAIKPSVSIAEASFKKLKRGYLHFGRADDAVAFPELGEEQCFHLRAAAVAFRYEACLATGSLQLCADTTLKDHLQASGYLVLDLCASPINAYASPRRVAATPCGVEADPSALPVSEKEGERRKEEEEEQPHPFCSAFADVDRFFGSLGSATQLVLEDLARRYPTSPLLLTYDVPYDEDLCELMFQKLEKDIIAASTSEGLAARIQYLLVLPIWWSIPFHSRRTVFLGGDIHVLQPNTQQQGVEDEVAAFLKTRTQQLDEGFRVPYSWPQRLAHTVREKDVLCWDALFLGNSYSYYCTATHQWLTGVTSTEVIALNGSVHRSKEGDGAPTPVLEEALRGFYGAKAVPPRE